MKLKKISYQNYPLFRLFLNYKPYNLINSSKRIGILENRQKLYLRQALKIIYCYHCNNASILFIGNYITKLAKKLKLNIITKHFFLPDNFLVRPNLYKNLIMLPELQKKVKKLDKYNSGMFINLVILSNNPNSQTITELNKQKIPYIFLMNRKSFSSIINKSQLYLNDSMLWNNFICNVLKRILKKNKKNTF